MRLISEDDVLALLINHHFDNDKGNFDLLIHNLCKEVRRIPPAYDVDAVISELGKASCVAQPVGWSSKKEIVELKTAIEIVKGGGVDE